MAVDAGTGLWSAFTARAELLGAAVMRPSSQDAALSLLRETTSGYACTRSAAAQFPHVGAGASPEHSDNLVAAAEFAVAETGSVAINEPADDRGRCFLAERLWLLVPDRELV